MKEKKKITRRQFLKGAAVGAVGLAALGFFGSRLIPGRKNQSGSDTPIGVTNPVPTNPFDFEKHTVLLNNGIEMPILGLGTFQLTPEQAADSTYWALSAGYRLIDTASAYDNEEGVGQGIKRAIDEGIVTREEIFITTKLWPMGGYNKNGINNALEKLGVDYIDLLLLHQPMGDYIGGYQAMEDAVEQGKLRAIGISNFSSSQMEEIMAIAKIPPAVQQVETHLYNQQGSMMDYLNLYGTVLESWFPLGGRGNTNTFFNIEEVQTIAAAHGKTAPQVIIRWHLQSGHVCIPGSTNESHIYENIGAYDFELTEEEMSILDALNKNEAYFKGMGGSEEETREMLEGWEERWNLDVTE